MQKENFPKKDLTSQDNIRRLKDNLLGFAESVKNLANRLGTKGKPLNSDERSILRMVGHRDLKQNLKDIEIAYLMGEREDMHDFIEELVENSTALLKY